MHQQKIACYVRVSTYLQNEDSQIIELRKWLTANGHDPDDPNVVEWFVDKASGTNLNRPEFERMQAGIFQGDFHTVIVWKLDRLSRKMTEGITLLCDWIEKRIRIVSTTQQFDFNGVVGQLVASVFLAVAEMENDLRRERQKAGIDAAKAAGKFKGGQPHAKLPERMTRARMLHSRGFRAEEIAEAMGCSRRTVFNYLAKDPE